MFRTASAAVLAAAVLAAPVASSGGDLDLRCTSVDRSLSERLRAVLARDQPPARTEVNDVMSRMAAARIDCKRGRVERGLRVYAQADSGLSELEAVDAAFIGPAAAPAGAAGAPE